jgi:hypothetical protein
MGEIERKLVSIEFRFGDGQFGDARLAVDSGTAVVAERASQRAAVEREFQGLRGRALTVEPVAARNNSAVVKQMLCCSFIVLFRQCEFSHNSSDKSRQACDQFVTPQCRPIPFQNSHQNKFKLQRSDNFAL